MFNLNYLRDLIHSDAVDHGFWSNNELKGECVKMILDEVDELMEATSDSAHFAEELADVIIMSLSVAGHLGIDIDAEVRRKMKINHDRPWRHDKYGRVDK